ncbi:C39 family peptidase [Paludisphaera mucosa]|uniref:Tetratricopeptide repeat protein n=1 Tax=Paludisphaera mucosa TaxID=3030827 RepID=A0ABT6FAK4_9BACT|nr:C39 family peptidase [Paludisphaera mucosa]MDG3004459.1 tetratricopeptide repeat protein [Paludisphaera mucosa]
MSATIEGHGAVAAAPADLGRIRELYEAGDYLGAFEVARGLGPMTRWPGASAKVLAGRLAWQLGAVRLGLALPLRAWRDDPRDPEALYYRARAMLGRRGPLAAWRFLGRVGPLDAAPDEIRADWEATHAMALGGLRDFERAELRLAEAERITPGRAWLRVERASLLEMEDRYEEALAAAREALALSTWYRPAVQSTAHLLQLLDREAEALEFLAEADRRMNSGVIVGQLAGFQFEAGLHAESMASLDRYEALSPMMDATTRRWLAARRSDAAYRLGDVAAAVTYAREAGEGFFREVADRMQAAEDDRRVRLGVRFVRQHHQTCAPATLAALARFWGREADHLEVAEAICYDGTPDHRERSWAGANGWRAREFTVTWDAAVALLDRGVPFTLTTVEPQSAHLQAVIGYDARRATLLIRDPTLPHEGEALAGPFLERYRSVGPRGMAMVPSARAELLDGVDLPDAGLFDRLHRIQVALRGHDRDAAAAELAAMRAEAPDHRLTHQARRHLALYDADGPTNLEVVAAMRAQFPDDVNLRLFHLSCLRELGRRDDRLALYREACAAPTADPILFRQFAEELLADARDQEAAGRMVARAMRARPTDAASISILARLAWNAGRRDEALELHRFASCLSDKDEWLARAYFGAARMLRRQEEPLALLHDRSRRYGARSSAPARTLHAALAMLDRSAEAQAVLDEALRFRPDDGELLLYAAEADAAAGEFERASARVEAARPHCRRGDWLRAAAALASARGDLPGSLALWRDVLRAEPAALDANRAAAGLLAETEGRAASYAHLESACGRSPHNYALHQALVEQARGEGPEVAEPALRRLLEIHPASAWGRREMAMLLSRTGRHDQAAAEMAVAAALEPDSTYEAGIRGRIHEDAGRPAEARAAYREAVRRDVDNEDAVARLIAICDSQADRLDAIAFVAAELERQVIFGDGLLVFARYARGHLGSDGLLATLVAAWEARPDLWHAWSALIDERVGRGELDEAEGLARRAAERFPLLPRIHLDLSAVLRVRGDVEGERAALRRALQISPGWGRAACQLAQSLEGEKLFEESRGVLERAVASAPLDAQVNGYLADALWSLGEKDAARDRIAVALRLDPGYAWAWRAFAAWSKEVGSPDAAVALAREVVAARAGDARAWKALEGALEDRPETLDERLAALDRAAALAPRDDVVHDRRAEILAEAGRFDEAEAACAPPGWGDRPPSNLRGRAAWVAARRGDRAGARARMRPIVEEEPDYAWGWRRLAEWAREDGDAPAYLEAAEQLARLDSGDPYSLGALGEARLRNGDRAGAKEGFRRALAIDPAYDFAALNLFTLELADGRLDAAEEALRPLMAPEYEYPAYVVAREVQLHAARKDRPAAIEALERLCVAADPGSEWPWRAADAALVAAGWRRAADRAFQAALARPGAAPNVGEMWASRRGALRAWRVGRTLRRLLPTGGEAARRALEAHVKVLGEARSGALLRLTVWRHRAALRAHADCWGMVGYALGRASRPRAVVRWLEDWTNRQGVKPWMLVALALAQRSLGRDVQANRIDRAAMDLPEDGRRPWHAAWLALDALCEGDAAAAAAWLAVPGAPDFNGLHAYVHGLATILLEVERADPGARVIAAGSGLRRLRELGRSSLVDPVDRALAMRACRRVGRRLAAHVPVWRRPLVRVGLELQPPRVAGRA